MRAFILMALMTVPAAALACPVCGTAGNEAQQWAFLSSTIFLSLAPILAIGGGGYWIWLQFARP